MEEDEYLEKHWQISSPHLNQKVAELVSLAGGQNTELAPLYQEILLTVIRSIQEDLNRWDAKIINSTLAELQKAFVLLKRYRRRRKVTIFGSARTSAHDPVYRLAVRLGALLAQQGFMSVTGAGGGIMHAAQEGAGAENSLGFNIALPYEQEANPVIANSPGLLQFKFFFTRKLFFAKEADALVLFPGGFGTFDEMFELLTLLQTGKSPLVPIVLMDVPGGNYWTNWKTFVEENLANRGYIAPHDLFLLDYASTEEACLETIAKFYSNYHSSRWVGKQLKFRLLKPLSEKKLHEINANFKDILTQGEFQQLPVHPQELDEPELNTLTRLSFYFNSRDYGRLRQLIDAVNVVET